MGDDKELIGKTIVYAEIGGYGIKLKFSDGSILDYSSLSDGDSYWEIIDDTKKTEMGNIKPCPFCGEQPVLQKVPITGYFGCFQYIIECENPECGCQVKLLKNDTVYHSDKEAKMNAITALNRRAGKTQ